ncbi:MAG: hypothetical protein IT203_05025 [Fimbriimonadaceae bacterium]|nr:hypothetical protein [Fimbriimonadaceae bacterium]
MNRFVFISLLFAVGCLARASIINLSTSEYAARYGYLRSIQVRATDPSFASAIRALTELEQMFPNKITLRDGRTLEAKDVGQPRIDELYWRSIDVLAYTAGSEEGLDLIPMRIGRPMGGLLPIKEVVAKLQSAMSAAKQPFASKWTDYKSRVDDAITTWKGSVGPKSDELLTWIAGRLKMATVPKSIQILVLPYSGGKEGMTIQTLDGWKVVIGAEKYTRYDFAEVVLHESTHVMDLISREKSLLARVRTALVKDNLDTTAQEQVPHLMIFEAAADAIKSIEPHHRPVGESNGAYSRLPKQFLPAVRAAKHLLVTDEDAGLRKLIEVLATKISLIDHGVPDSRSAR